MELKTFPLKLRTIGEDNGEGEGEFSGLASTYDNVDLGGDTVKRGAFTKSIADQGKGVPILWQHRTSQPIGVGRITDAPGGLLLTGKLVMADPIAKRAHAHMKAGSVRGLSIGYDIIKATPRADTGGKDLHEVRLHEVSVVTLPMNRSAELLSVKSLLPVLASLNTSDFEDDDELLGDLRSIDVYVKRLLPTPPAPPPDPAIAQAARLEQLKALDALLRKAFG